MISPPFKYTALSALLLLAACGQKQEEPANGAAAQQIEAEKEDVAKKLKEVSFIDPTSLLSKESRPAADKELDAARKPDEVLKFINIKKGWTVLELEAGDGYYTELLSGVVGPNGRVYMQNPKEFESFLGDALEKRLGENRLPNVRYINSEFDEIPLADETPHVVTWILGPHELYFKPENKPEGFGDPVGTFKDIARVMRPNGRLLVVDHRDLASSTEADWTEKHRISSEQVIALAAEAGLVVDKTSDALSNDSDDYTKNVFSPEVRRKTDRFIISFKKAD